VPGDTTRYAVVASSRGPESSVRAAALARNGAVLLLVIIISLAMFSILREEYSRHGSEGSTDTIVR
jgi:hypothetical protein